MDSQSSHDASPAGDNASQHPHAATNRRQSLSQGSHSSDDSHTALDFIRSQMQLEADAREALPYSIENCTKPLGRLRQAVFACLTCNPAREIDGSFSQETIDSAAGVCYACSVQCHGEHTLVELFNKRNFTCDCGTTRIPATSPCCLRIDPKTNTKGAVHSETPDSSNEYNQNFRNRFCGCSLDYDPFQQKGTMFQCLGLGTNRTGGCGEDWWHPGCVVGLGPKWYEVGAQDSVGNKPEEIRKVGEATATEGCAPLPTISEAAEDKHLALNAPGTSAVRTNDDDSGANREDGDDVDVDDDDDDDDDEPPMPPGFPKEDEFEGFICYKCVDAFPWIRRYAGTAGFLPAVPYQPQGGVILEKEALTKEVSQKRKAEDDGEPNTKRARSGGDTKVVASEAPAMELAAPFSSNPACKRTALPPPPKGRFSIFFTGEFRDQLCRCADCFPLLTAHPQLLEQEETYEPPVSDDGGSNAEGGGIGSGSHGSGSIYERGESALRNVDRVRAIEGVMAYNHLKDKLKPFFQQFAESGQAISAEDIKVYFAKLRGDEQAIREAGEAARSDDNRREQSGY